MKRRVSVAAMATVIAALGVGVAYATSAAVTQCSVEKEPFCYGPSMAKKAETIEDVTMPKLAIPQWMETVTVPETTQTVTYQVLTKGVVTTGMDEFRSAVAETLNSPQGWARLGVRFERVESDGQFMVWLSQDKEVPSFAPGGCDAIVSCTVGNNVIINETRWLNGSEAWNAAGGSLRDYQHMVLNHETGHWLGHGHRYCSQAGADAPIMQQQTLDMQGCQPNPWPQVNELYAPNLGIYS